MNKKLLLVTLPVLLAMTGCQSARVNNQLVNKALVSDMVEDTLAHEEVFGGVEDTHIFKANPAKATVGEPTVKIGCQIQFNDKNTQSTADDTISIRFLAALSDGSVTAVWHRGLAQPNGYEGAEPDPTNHSGVWKYKFTDSTETTTSSKKYDALNNGNVRIAAGEEGEYEDYQCFVIYTLMNIPYEQFKDSYLAAYVSLGNNNSKALAVKIEKDGDYPKNSFSFDPNVTGHFLQGTINGSKQLIYATEHESGGNYASYSNLSLKTTDSFGSFYYSKDSNFQFFGYNDFVQNTANLYFGASSLSGYNKPKFDGTFSVYISSSNPNKVYGSTTKTVSVSFATNYDTGMGKAIFIAGDMTNWKALADYRLSNSGNDWSGTFTITIGTRVKYVVGPWDGGDGSRWESGDGHYIAHDTTSISVEDWE